MKNRLKIIVFIILICVFGNVIFAKPTTSPQSSIIDKFSLILTKPYINEFFFSNPADTTQFYGDSVNGVGFPVADSNNKSTADIGITFDLDSNGLIEVFCNSKKDRTGDYMMESSSTGFNFDTVVLDKNSKEQKSKKYNPSNDAKKPVFTYTNSKPMEAQAAYILTMTIDSSDLVSGQYQGFLIMVFTPSA